MPETSDFASQRLIEVWCNRPPQHSGHCHFHDLEKGVHACEGLLGDMVIATGDYLKNHDS